MINSLRVFSYGGGVQSTAALVLAAQGELNVDFMLFCNVGDDSENPATLRYVREIAMPYASAHGIALRQLCRTRRDGSTETLYGRLTRGSARSIGIPVRLGGSGAPARRNCTTDFKIRVVASWCWRHGARATRPATTLIGISLDEAWRRMRNDSGFAYTRLEYPLVERRISRADCVAIIERAGLPVPPKSSCWFCPYHSLNAWRELRNCHPDLFAQACDLEALLSDRAARIHAGRGYRDDKVYMTDKRVPLARAVGTAVQMGLFSDESDACESGFCMT